MGFESSPGSARSNPKYNTRDELLSRTPDKKIEKGHTSNRASNILRPLYDLSHNQTILQL